MPECCWVFNPKRRGEMGEGHVYLFIMSQDRGGDCISKNSLFPDKYVCVDLAPFLYFSKKNFQPSG